MRLLGWVGILALAPVAASEHKPLLPRPQEVRYLSGTLPLAGLSIRLTGQTTAEDRFAAGQLAAGLSAAARSTVSVRNHDAAGAAVILTRTGELGALPAAAEQAGPDSREAYTLTVTPKGAEIRARTSAGLFYGVQTMLQLVEGAAKEAALPAVAIRDWPSLAYRGFMMDLGHGQLLRVSEIERQLDLLARFKANQYYFYSEATIELDGYSLVNPDGRYTQEEIRRIIAYARQRHIDVVPCLELYGHLHDLFRVERFAALGLPRYGGEFDPRQPAVRRMLEDLVNQTTSLFPSPWYHVGFDEPWALGKIGGTAAVDPFRTYIDVLRGVAAQAQKRHKRLMFWADMLSGARIFSNHPELIEQLPQGTIAVPWVYNRRADYTPYLEPLARMNVATVVAPGVWNWNEVFPDYHQTFENINGLLATGRKYNTLGILNTGWADDAQTIYRMSWPGLALGAVAGWQSEPVQARSYFRDYAQQMYPNAIAADVADALEDLSSAQEIFSEALQGPTMHRFWADPLEPARLERLQAREDNLRKARLLAESADERLQRALRSGGDALTLRPMLLAARMFDYLGMKNLYAIEFARYFQELRANATPDLITLYLSHQIGAQDHGMLADLQDAITGLREHYRTAWLEESTTYRMGSALARWDAEAELWRAMQSRVPELVSEYRKGARPSLENLRTGR